MRPVTTFFFARKGILFERVPKTKILIRSMWQADIYCGRKTHRLQLTTSTPSLPTCSLIFD